MRSFFYTGTGKKTPGGAGTHTGTVPLGTVSEYVAVPPRAHSTTGSRDGVRLRPTPRGSAVRPSKQAYQGSYVGSRNKQTHK